MTRPTIATRTEHTNHAAICGYSRKGNMLAIHTGRSKIGDVVHAEYEAEKLAAFEAGKTAARAGYNAAPSYYDFDPTLDAMFRKGFDSERLVIAAEQGNPWPNDDAFDLPLQR